MLLHMKQIPNIFTSVVGGVAPTLRALPVHICKREIPEREETRSQTRTGKAIVMCKKAIQSHTYVSVIRINQIPLVLFI